MSDTTTPENVQAPELPEAPVGTVKKRGRPKKIKTDAPNSSTDVQASDATPLQVTQTDENKSTATIALDKEPSTLTPSKTSNVAQHESTLEISTSEHTATSSVVEATEKKNIDEEHHIQVAPVIPVASQIPPPLPHPEAEPVDHFEQNGPVISSRITQPHKNGVFGVALAILVGLTLGFVGYIYNAPDKILSIAQGYGIGSNPVPLPVQADTETNDNGRALSYSEMRDATHASVDPNLPEPSSVVSPASPAVTNNETAPQVDTSSSQTASNPATKEEIANATPTEATAINDSNTPTEQDDTKAVEKDEPTNTNNMTASAAPDATVSKTSEGLSQKDSSLNQDIPTVKATTSLEKPAVKVKKILVHPHPTPIKVSPSPVSAMPVYLATEDLEFTEGGDYTSIELQKLGTILQKFQSGTNIVVYPAMSQKKYSTGALSYYLAGQYYADDMKTRLVRLGIPASKIQLVKPSEVLNNHNIPVQPYSYIRIVLVKH